MCAMVLKEAISYYVNNGNSVYCTLLDATTAFDRVEYVKMCKLLLDRKLPPVCIRLLVNMYTSQVTRVKWNGVCFDYFSVGNGVNPGEVISSVLFCVYVDGLLKLLSDAKVGCYIGHVFVGALAYADDIVLLAPTARPCANYCLCAMNLRVDSMYCLMLKSRNVCISGLRKIISLIAVLSKCLISMATQLNLLGRGHISVI